jgi:F-type H+-transporting ATPase subunit a
MVAGHILLAVLLSFIGMAFTAGAAVGFAIAIPVVLGSVAITMLELFVAFLQAFIFTFLTTVFIGMAVNIHHDDEHHEPEAHTKGHEGPHSAEPAVLAHEKA